MSAKQGARAAGRQADASTGRRQPARAHRPALGEAPL